MFNTPVGLVVLVQSFTGVTYVNIIKVLTCKSTVISYVVQLIPIKNVNCVCSTLYLHWLHFKIYKMLTLIIIIGSN